MSKPKLVKSKKIVLKTADAKRHYKALSALQSDSFASSGNTEGLKGLARRIHKKTLGGGDARASVSRGNYTPDAQYKRAGLTVGSELDPQLAQSANYRSGVAELYKTLAQQQAANQGNINAANATASADTASRYGALSDKIAKNYSAGNGQASAEQQRLGITAPYSQEQSSQSSQATLADSSKANALTNINASGQSYNQLMSLLGGEEAQTGAQTQAAALQNETSLKGSRRGKVYALAQQLKDAAKAAQAETAQQNFMNQIAGGKLGVAQTNAVTGQGKLAETQKSGAAARKIAKQKVIISKQRADSQATVDAAKVGLTKAQIAKALNDAKGAAGKRDLTQAETLAALARAKASIAQGKRADRNQ